MFSVAGIIGACLLGLVAKRLKLPSILGYLAAGILIGPHTPGMTANLEIATEFSEIGVILLMFSVGMHFSLKDLLSVRRVAIPGAILQMLFGIALGTGLAQMAGFSLAEGIAFGFALSVASTIVAMRSLEQRKLLDTHVGKITVGWLIVEDIMTVIVIVMMPVLAALLASGQEANLGDIAYKFSIALVKIAAFATMMIVIGRRLLPWLLVTIAKTRSRELMSLGVVAIALGFAYMAYTLFGTSFALGAFLTGFVLNESEIGHKSAEQSVPLRDTFSVLFFVSVGMLFDPSVLVKNPVQVLMALSVVAVGISLATFVIMRFFRQSLRNSVLVAVSLAQIGEFSFITAGMARQLGMLSPHLYDVILAAALLSIGLNPFLFRFMERWAPETVKRV
ncbi:MAG: cation:proton antiporter [Proteobacteria bacterium]|nr:cation:proton antiporter [Pseudomonadota bacterium]